LSYKECWVPKNWCFWTVVLEKTLESPLDCKEIQPVHSEGDQPWIFIGRNDAETPILWPPDAKNWLIGKDPDSGKRLKAGGEGDDRGWDGWMASLTQWTWVWVNSGSWWWTERPGVLHPWGHKESDMTEQLNWTESYIFYNKYVLCCAKSIQSCPALCNLMDYSPLVSSVHGVLLARILEWVAALLWGIFLTRGSNLHL